MPIRGGVHVHLLVSHDKDAAKAHADAENLLAPKVQVLLGKVRPKPALARAAWPSLTHPRPRARARVPQDAGEGGPQGVRGAHHQGNGPALLDLAQDHDDEDAPVSVGARQLGSVHAPGQGKDARWHLRGQSRGQRLPPPALEVLPHAMVVLAAPLPAQGEDVHVLGRGLVLDPPALVAQKEEVKGANGKALPGGAPPHARHWHHGAPGRGQAAAPAPAHPVDLVPDHLALVQEPAVGVPHLVLAVLSPGKDLAIGHRPVQREDDARVSLPADGSGGGGAHGRRRGVLLAVLVHDHAVRSAVLASLGGVRSANPLDDDVLPGGKGELVAVRGEGDAVHGLVLGGQGGPEHPGLGPELDLSVLAARREGGSVEIPPHADASALVRRGHGLVHPPLPGHELEGALSDRASEALPPGVPGAASHAGRGPARPAVLRRVLVEAGKSPEGKGGVVLLLELPVRDEGVVAAREELSRGVPSRGDVRKGLGFLALRLSVSLLRSGPGVLLSLLLERVGALLNKKPHGWSPGIPPGVDLSWGLRVLPSSPTGSLCDKGDRPSVCLSLSSFSSYTRRGNEVQKWGSCKK